MISVFSGFFHGAAGRAEPVWYLSPPANGRAVSPIIDMDLPDNLLDIPAEEAARLLALRRLDETIQARLRLGVPGDVEALHDFRVALRRLRSCVRAYGPQLAPSVSRRTRRRLRALARAAGRSRDLEVYQAWAQGTEPDLKAYQRPGLAWLLARLGERRIKADRRLEQRIAQHFAKAEARLRERLPVYRATIRLTDGRREASAGAVLGQLVLQLASDLNSRLTQVHSLGDQAEAHAVRIAAKRLRYLLEPFESRLPDVPPVIERLKSLQQVLGDLQDAHMFAIDLAGALQEAAVEQAQRVSREILVWSPLTPDERGGGDEDVRLGLLTLAQRVRDAAESAYARFAAEWLTGSAGEFFEQLAELAHGLSAPAASGIEIERKYLLSGLPPSVTGAPVLEIEQGWLPGERLVERFRRVRSNGTEACFRTIKAGAGVSRIEIEEETTPAIFAGVWPLTEGCRVRKRRYRLPDGNLVWEIDEFLDRDLIVAEVELPSTDVEVETPSWLKPYIVREVTGDEQFTNRALAR